jgi:hypothetical protein
MPQSPPWLKTPLPWFRSHGSATAQAPAHSPRAPPPTPERDNKLMVVCGGSFAVPRLPWCDLKLSWIATGQSSCGALSPLPPLPIVTPCGRCPCNVHPKSQPKVRFSCSGLVAGCYSLVASNAQVAACCSLRFRMAVVKSVGTQPPEDTSLVLPPLRGAHSKHCWKALLAVHCLGSAFFPSFKSHCRLSKKLEWCPPLPVRQRAHHPPSRLGFLLPFVGRPKCRE